LQENPDNKSVPTPITDEIGEIQPTIEPIDETDESQFNINPDDYQKEILKLAPVKIDPTVYGLNEDATPIYRPELNLLNEILILMKSGKKLPESQGQKGGNIISVNDFDMAEIKSWKTTQTKYDQGFGEIPKDLENLFENDIAQKEIRAIAYAARQEYIDMLKIYNVHPDLVNELDKYVFPADEDHIQISYTENLYKEYPFVNKFNTKELENGNDVSESYMRYEMGFAYSAAYRIYQTGILGKVPTNQQDRLAYWKKAREIGFRLTFFHEMTHVLQNAYRNRVSRTLGREEYKDLEPIDKGMEKFMPESIYWDTKTTYMDEFDNYIIAMEGQAEVFGFHFYTTIFDFTPAQKEILRNYMHGGKRLSLVRESMKKVKANASGDEDFIDNLRYGNPEYIFDSINDPALAEFLDSITLNIGHGTIAAYEGYLQQYDYDTVMGMIKELQKKPY
jgi:hypothetical protein